MRTEKEGARSCSKRNCSTLESVYEIYPFLFAIPTSEILDFKSVQIAKLRAEANEGLVFLFTVYRCKVTSPSKKQGPELSASTSGRRYL